MVYSLSLLEPGENLRFLVQAIRREKLGDRQAHYLPGRIAENTFRRFVPTHYDALQVFANDRVVGRIDDRLIQKFGRDEIGFTAHRWESSQNRIPKDFRPR